MNPSKLLISGVATVGTIATAVVVSHQSGIIFSSKEETSVNIKTNKPAVQNIKKDPIVNGVSGFITQDMFSERVGKPNQEAVSKWLKDNQVNGTWDVQVKKGGASYDFRYSDVTNDDLEGLDGHLESQKDLLKSLSVSSETQKTTFVFEKTSGEWKHIWTKEHIDAWVDKNSENKATLEIENISSLNQENFGSLYEFLKSKKTELFKDLTSSSPDNRKTILLAIINDGWKHSKTEITSWLGLGDGGNNKFKIKIQTSNGDQEFDNVDETNLVGLLGYLKEKKDTLLKLVKDSNPTHLIFKKGNPWEVVHDETTINNWVENTSNGKAALKLWENNSEQQLSNLKTKDGEFKKLFDALGRKEGLFQESNLSDASTSSKKTIVFEKYGTSGTEQQWMHIKDAIKEIFGETDWEKYKSKIKIKRSSEVSIENANDDELTGLIKHIGDRYETECDSCEEDSGCEDYESLLLRSSDLVLEKKSDGSNNNWARINNESK